MLINLVINAIAFYVLANIVPGVRISGGIQSLIIISIVWGVLSMFLKPILILLTLPVNILSLGLFSFIINAFLLILMTKIVPGFSIDDFTTAIVAAVVLAILNMFLSKLK